jgi:hypothetical protein
VSRLSSLIRVVELEREVGWELTPEIEAEVEGISAAVIADSVQRVALGVRPEPCRAWMAPACLAGIP